MLQQVEVRSPLGALLTLPLGDTSSGIYIKEVGGLDPVKATLVTSSFAGEDGEQYHTMRREPRDVTLKLGLEPDYAVTTVRGLRAQLYNYFMTGAPVNLRFYESDGLIVQIDGRVETCTAPQFTQEPEMEVSIHCFKPDLLEMGNVGVNGTTVSSDTSIQIDYEGSVETGINFKLLVDRDMSDFTIYHSPADGSLRTLEFSAALVNGDVVEINTSKGNKYVTLNHAGGQSGILRAVSPQSNWIELQPGPNQFRVYTTSAGVPWQMTYLPRHGAL